MSKPDLRAAAYAVTYVTFAVGFVSNLVRLYTRRFISKTWGLDDGLAIVVLFVNIGQLVVLQMLLNLDCGQSMAASCSFKEEPLFQVALIEEVVLYTVHFSIKLTFLCFYLRLSPQAWFRRMVYIGIAINASIFMSSMLLTFLQCDPFEAIIKPSLHPDAKRLDQFTVMITPPVLNIAMDAYILILPVRTVLHLQMSLRRRLAILTVIGSGICSLIISCIRIPVVIATTNSPDTSNELGKMIIIVALEIQFAVVAVNMPSFPSLKARWQRTKYGKQISDESGPKYQDGIELCSKQAKPPRIGRSQDRPMIGTITRLERGILDVESEEELCRPQGKEPELL